MSDDELDDRAREVFAAIQEYIDSNGYPPSVKDLVHETDCKSTETVHRRLKKLESHGWIERKSRTSRSIRVTRDD